jgi:RNA polymerase sigma factor (sigma-70 family)
LTIQDKNNQKALWLAFRNGNREAFNDIVQQHYPLLLNYGVRLVQDRLFVEDCLQDFFINIWQNKAGLSDIDNIKAYLLLSFRRRLFKEKEKNNRLGIVNELVENYDFDMEFDIESQLIEQENQDENHAKLKQHLDALTKRQREAIYLRFYQDLSYHEIGDIMGINQHSAINLVYDALRLMRKHWQIVLPFIFSNIF